MKIGIVGLGLIGGSLALAFQEKNHEIYGLDSNAATQQYAMMTGAIDSVLDKETIPVCDFLFLTVYPTAAVDFMLEHSPLLSPKSVVIDCCGIKRKVCGICFDLAEKFGYHFIGGHPMAGLQFSGFKHARADLFQNANMILVPKKGEDIALLERVKLLLSEAGFASVTLTSAEKHDEIIAFTSQLAHVVSNAYVKSPSASYHKGFSAGSYRDLTRVAKLNETMWTELFMANKDYLTREIECLIDALSEYKEALESENSQMLFELLRQGRLQKEAINTEWKESE